MKNKINFLIISLCITSLLAAAKPLKITPLLKHQQLADWIQQCKSLDLADATDSQCTAEQLLGTLQIFQAQETTRLLKQPWIRNNKPNFGSFQPFTQKLVIPSHSNIYAWGDLHGDIQSLVFSLEKLRQENTISDSFVITKPNTYFLFLGDYTDRGQHGAEIWYTIARLKLANPDRVFMVRGNHEEVGMNFYNGFGAELKRKFNKNSNNLLELIDQAYQLLPVAIYLGCKGINGVTNYLQCCHGGMEAGYLPAQLFKDPRRIVYEIITELPRHNHLCKLQPKQELCALFFNNFSIPEHFINISQRQLSPDNIGFMWSDFSATGNTKLSWENPRRGMSFGQDLTEALVAYQNDNKAHQLRGILRGHQHNPTMPGLLKSDNKGLYKLPWQAPVFTTVATKLFVQGPCFLKITTAPQFSDWAISRMFYVSNIWETQSNSLSSWENA